ncbi:Radical SAM superfamily enzyme, MoaA/NifB/PqqE/SkfB family [Anaerosporobacter mobilis DSM 15930]|jgi:MoaA/NifB/PqqE/SkfB family radical SAM enzyme|uniref:Radical SAM superfamily enzyme, MoaA/NifB/PqqE/SkfB family n=1 Tax=Anaerosporobacter mobilis DSM 15930 TaxID=1120996 RepID=A0A1M7JJL8_9FIRM|nr:radical SAM protein [Anaerosporobacter mobilis]SHM52697.1 Radical SAM superfamily enzyme, MoaA/NifB/PqqE/SkfB family [Anaerosporobacter mobilis DSM 15930]
MGKKRVIVWRITQTCNMTCKFCSYSKEVIRQRNDANLEEVERVSDILGKYKQKTGEELLISFIGGEPFLWEPILNLSKKMAMEYGVEISTTTNGILLASREVRKTIINYFSEIVISVDGFEECNDDVRQCVGHFKTVSENIAKLVQEKREAGSNLVIKVNTILMRKNIGQFEEFCEYLANLGVNEITFNQLGGYDRPEFYGDNRLEPMQVAQLIERLPHIRERLSKYGFIVHGSESYLERILLTTENRKNPIIECNPCSWFWFINENGYISPCSYTSYEYKYDTKQIKSLEDIAQVELYYRELRQCKRSKWCEDCYCTQVYDKFE